MSDKKYSESSLSNLFKSVSPEELHFSTAVIHEQKQRQILFYSIKTMSSITVMVLGIIGVLLYAPLSQQVDLMQERYAILMLEDMESDFDLLYEYDQTDDVVNGVGEDEVELYIIE
ncbi:MAG: hypothetical protein OCC49_07170 [Fibrobacterales bacterium]